MPAASTASRRATVPQVQRTANVARLAREHADHALSHLLHVNGFGPIAEDLYDQLHAELRDVMREQLLKTDIRALVRSSS